MVQISSLIVPLTILASLGQAKVHNVDVGNGGFIFSPKSLTAKVGDHVNFHFFAGDHSVAQSTFAAPCVPSGPKAIYSGFLNPSSGAEASEMFSMRVNSTAPLWLYCSQFGHCQSGMSMVINPPKASTGHTLNAYQSASGGKGEVSPAKVFGGVLIPNSGGKKRDAAAVPFEA